MLVTQALSAAFAMYAGFMPGLDVNQLMAGNVPEVLQNLLPVLVGPVVAPGRAYQLSELTNNLVVGRLTVRKT